MIRVLVLHTSIGHGIKVTAENIARQLEQNKMFEVSVADFHEVAPGPLVSILQNIYFYFTEAAPFIWGWLYSDAVARLTIPFRMLAASFRYKQILTRINEFGPDVVVSTETVPSGVVAYLKYKNLYRGKLVIVISDYHLHRFWLYDEADLYLCVTEEQTKGLLALGVPRGKIALTGMIVAEKYSKKISRAAAAKHFGLDPSIPTVLLSGGRRGLLSSKAVTQKLLQIPGPLQIVIVAGLNEDLKHELSLLRTEQQHSVKILGFVSEQYLLMQAVDLMISKPGGPTIAEAVTIGLPVIITGAHPGHETKNMEFLTRTRVAWYGRNPQEVARLTEQILRGQLKFDAARAYETIIKPKKAVNCSSAIAALAPLEMSGRERVERKNH